MGLHKYCRSTPLLRALEIVPLSMLVGTQSLNLLKSAITGSSSAASFYSHLFSKNLNCDPIAPNVPTLMNAVNDFAELHDVDVLKFILVDSYANTMKRTLKGRFPVGVDGMVDSVRTLLSVNNMNLINLLLFAF